MRFEGKTIIVTGGARGVGRACVEAFASEGGAVVVADSAVEAGQALVAEIGSRGGKAQFVRADVAEPRDAGCLVDATLEWACGVDVLVTTAETFGSAGFLDYREAEFDAALRVNLKGAFLAGQAAARAMAARGRGTIVHVAPADPGQPAADQVANLVSRGGIAQLTYAMALALAGHNIRVNAVDPGPLAHVSGPAEPAAVGVGEAAEIVRLILFLASAAAGARTGQCLDAVAGRLAMSEETP